MKVAVISDIHSNYYALRAVLRDVKKNNIKNYIILGDIFGYYPWAVDTYKLIRKIKIFKIVKGNHDDLLSEKNFKKPGYYDAIRFNKKKLKIFGDEVFRWLKKIPHQDKFKYGNFEYVICHGTPEDPVNGRYYPDNKKKYSWFPKKNQILMLGHTHYPLLKTTENNGVVVNPGSVGQSRDGNMKPSWIEFDLNSKEYKLHRVSYDIGKVVNILEKMHWNKKYIISLQKTYELSISKRNPFAKK